MKNPKLELTKHYWLLPILSLFFLTGALTAQNITDPTRPPDEILAMVNGQRVSSGPTLTAIFIYQNRRFAIINGHIVKPGDQLGPYILTNIHNDAVELKGNLNNSIILPLLPKVKQARADSKG